MLKGLHQCSSSMIALQTIKFLPFGNQTWFAGKSPHLVHFSSMIFPFKLPCLITPLFMFPPSIHWPLFFEYNWFETHIFWIYIYMNDKSHFFLVKSPLITIWYPPWKPSIFSRPSRGSSPCRPSRDLGPRGRPKELSPIEAAREAAAKKGLRKRHGYASARRNSGTMAMAFLWGWVVWIYVVIELMLKMNGWGIVIVTVVICSYSFFGGLMIDVVSICFKDDLAPKQWSKVFVVFSWGFWRQLRLGGSPLRVATVLRYPWDVFCRFQLLLYLFVFKTIL